MSLDSIYERHTKSDSSTKSRTPWSFRQSEGSNATNPSFKSFSIEYALPQQRVFPGPSNTGTAFKTTATNNQLFEAVEKAPTKYVQNSSCPVNWNRSASDPTRYSGGGCVVPYACGCIANHNHCNYLNQPLVWSHTPVRRRDFFKSTFKKLF